MQWRHLNLWVHTPINIGYCKNSNSHNNNDDDDDDDDDDDNDDDDDDQTIVTFERNTSQNCWAQHVVCVWPP